MITQTSLNNPRFINRIKRHIWLARLESMAKHKRSTQYVKNRKGHNSLRIDFYPDGELAVYAAGQGMRNYANMVIDALDLVYSK